MVCSRVFGLLAITLYLFISVCANAAVSEEEVKQAVKEAQESTRKTLDSVQGAANDAEGLKNNVDTYRRNAEEAAAEAAQAAKGNEAAEAIAQNAKNVLEEVRKAYSVASTMAMDYIDSMMKLREVALEFNTQAQDILNTKTHAGYEEKRELAIVMKLEAEALDKRIAGATKSYANVMNAQKEMLKFVSAVQVAKYHVDGVVAVAKIETLMQTADSDLKLTEKKKEEIAATVQEIKKLVDANPRASSQHISGLLLSAEGELKSYSSAVEKAKKAKESIPEQKKGADGALAKLKDEKDVENAKKECGIVQTAATEAAKSVEEIKNALKSATTSANNALDLKSDVEDAISGKTKKPDVTQDNNKVNPQDATGGPASGDSAMTVSVPLLLSLIACAALH